MSDHTRFEELVLPHLNAAYNLARWLTHDVNDAEDVVQDACVRALKYVGSLNGSSARAWFLTIVRHAFYDWCKRNRPAEIAPDDGSAIDMAVDPAAVVQRADILERAHACVLNDVFRIVDVARQPPRQVVGGIQVRQDQLLETGVIGQISAPCFPV